MTSIFKKMPFKKMFFKKGIFKQGILTLGALVLSLTGTGCTSNKKETLKVWIYTSLYKDTISDIQPKLEKQFPGVEFSFYQAGSEEVASKVAAEQMAGEVQADLLISSDRFWYEDLARQGKLLSYRPIGSEAVPAFFKNSEGFYATVSHPVMVLAYNSEVITEADAPKSFKELTDAKWKAKLSTGSPLASGTSFTTVAFLQKAYGWDYFKALRKNDLIAEGGNSGVIRRLQSKERPVGLVLLENILRFQETDPRIKAVMPSDGVVIQSNVLSIVKKELSPEKKELVQKVADWMFAKEGQEAMVRSYMYASMPGYQPPKGAPTLAEVMKAAKPWTQEFLDETMQARESIKEEFSKIVF